MLIGHEKIQNYLNTLLKTSEGGRNLLFLGPRAIGKRLLAERYGRARLCEKKSALIDEACDCGSCKAYAHSLHPDYIVLDCATADGTVLEMRKLKERLAHTPLHGARIVIFDNAEEMTTEAGNALLKTLEDPRGDTSFLMIAHRDTLLRTVRSRFEIIRVGLVRPEQLLGEIKHCSAEDAELLAYLAQGKPGLLLRLQRDERAVRCAQTYGSHLATFLQGSVYQRLRYFDTVKEESILSGRELTEEELKLWPFMLMDWLAVTEGAQRFYPVRYQHEMKQGEFSRALLLKALATLLTIEQLKSRYTLNASLLEEQLTLI